MVSPPQLVIFVDWFEPAYKAGGPVRSIANLSRLLSQTVEIRIFTSDKDHGDTDQMPGIQIDRWTDFEPNISVWYASEKGYHLMLKEFKSLNPTAIYFNSLFSIRYFLRPLIQSLSVFPESRKIIAPRGMLHQGALQYGTYKKRLYLAMLKLTGWAKKLTWQATDQQERLDIKRHIGEGSTIRDAGNVPTILAHRKIVLREKSTNSLRSLFVSRIQPKKNLEFFLQLLMDFSQPLEFDIIGPVEDESYWEECQEIIQRLPDHIRVSYLGAMPHSSILTLQQDYDFFVLPTFGENFGHSIYDALAGGLPVLISDQTPWRDLSDSNAGLDLTLDASIWLKALESWHSISAEEWEEKKMSARRFASQYIDSQDFTSQYHQLFFKE